MFLNNLNLEEEYEENEVNRIYTHLISFLSFFKGMRLYETVIITMHFGDFNITLLAKEEMERSYYYRS